MLSIGSFVSDRIEDTDEEDLRCFGEASKKMGNQRRFLSGRIPMSMVDI